MIFYSYFQFSFTFTLNTYQTVFLRLKCANLKLRYYSQFLSLKCWIFSSHTLMVNIPSKTHSDTMQDHTLWYIIISRHKKIRFKVKVWKFCIMQVHLKSNIYYHFKVFKNLSHGIIRIYLDDRRPIDDNLSHGISTNNRFHKSEILV